MSTALASTSPSHLLGQNLPAISLWVGLVAAVVPLGALVLAATPAGPAELWASRAVGQPMAGPAVDAPAIRQYTRAQTDGQFVEGAGQEGLVEGMAEQESAGQAGSPQGWFTTVGDWGAALYVSGAAALAFALGRRDQKARDQEKTNEATGLQAAQQSWVMAALAEPSSSNAAKFFVGIGWFFAHQLIGVGNDVIMKYVGGNLAVPQIVFLRFAFATLTMLPFMAASGPEAFATNRLPLHLARSVLLAGGIGLYCTGLTIAPIAVVTTLNFTIPLFTLVLSRVFLKERVGALRWCATLAGFLGVMVVLQPARLAFNPQWLVVLVGAALFAGLDVLNKAFVGKESFWAMIFYTALFTAGLSAYPAAQVWAPVTGPQLRLLAALGGGANLLLFCLLKAFSLVDASALAPFRYTELLLSALVGFLVFAEVPALTTLIGAAVIIPSALFVVWQESQAGDDPAALPDAATA